MPRKFTSTLVESLPVPTLKLVKVVYMDRKRPFLLLVESYSPLQASRTKGTPGQGQLTVGRDPHWAIRRGAIRAKKMQPHNATIMTGNSTQPHREIAYHQRGASKSHSSSSYCSKLSKLKTLLWVT